MTAGLNLTPGHVEAIRDEHNPANQDHGYKNRCALCQFTRWPCDPHDLAVDWLTMYTVLHPTQKADPT